MKRTHPDDEVPIRLLANDPVMRPFIQKWGDTEFDINEMPIEVLIKIVFSHMDSVLAIFSLNRNLYAIQSTKGFWSSLFKLAYRDHAIMLYAFLTEASLLSRVWPDAIRMQMAFTAIGQIKDDNIKIWYNQTKGDDEYNEVYTVAVSDIVRRILNGDIECLDPYYTMTIPDHQFPILRANTDSYEFVNRRCMFQLIIMIDEASICDRSEIVNSLTRLAKDEYTLSVSPEESMVPFIDYWINEMTKQKTTYQRSYATKLSLLKEEFMKEIKTINELERRTGKRSDGWSVYSQDIDEYFQSFFGFTDDEANMQWKKILVVTNRQYYADNLSYGTTINQCSFCHLSGNDTLSLDSTLSISFCDVKCQSGFYNHFSS